MSVFAAKVYLGIPKYLSQKLPGFIQKHNFLGKKLVGWEGIPKYGLLVSYFHKFCVLTLLLPLFIDLDLCQDVRLKKIYNKLEDSGCFGCKMEQTVQHRMLNF
jgi:hypothetical protein